MIMKFCPRCNKLHPVDQPCPNGCYSKERLKEKRKEQNKFYDQNNRKNKDIYHSKQWLNLRKECLNKFDYICIYTLMKYKKVLPATLVHHIIEVEENKTQAFELTNLIPVCDLAHREIHRRYKEENVKEVQAELRKYLERYHLR